MQELHRHFKQGQISWEECKYAAWLRRDKISKVRTFLQLILARGAKNIKGFYRCVNQKTKFEKNIPSTMSKNGELVTTMKRLRFPTTFLGFLLTEGGWTK